LLVLKQMPGKQSDAAMRSMAATTTPGETYLCPSEVRPLAVHLT